MIHESKIRVYYEHTDAEGVVWHPNYLGFGSRARVDWMREIGMPIDKMRDEGFYFPVITVNIRYRKPALLDDLLIVRTEVLQHKRVSMVFKQQIVKADEPDIMLCELETKVGCVGVKTHKPVPVPEKLLALMK